MVVVGVGCDWFVFVWIDVVWCNCVVYVVGCDGYVVGCYLVCVDWM